ncbi:MAG: glycosyltransferase family 4 protein, partial [Chthoniobacterales bacterium]
RHQLRRASDAAVRHADVINVPNESEAECLRKQMHVTHPVMVEPYGLSDARRLALQQAAESPEARLAQKRVCFIGMWSPRKGAHDWARIIARIRSDVPDARFRFLGTMVDESVIRRDLGDTDPSGMEFISEYHPDTLPRLLRDCAVGAFPSYVEGFGLAVIEQLAAGIPTFAYDTPGPRDILKRGLPECLVQSGDVLSFGARISEALRISPNEYRDRSRRSIQIAAAFSWREIARSTLDTYRRVLHERARPVAFIQPFSVGSAGGGARILRALLQDAPFAARSICTSPGRPKPWRNELHVPSRPSWGAVEHSRLAALPAATNTLFARAFRRRLKRRLVEMNASAIHAVPHGGLDFAQAQTVARELALPFFISLHDDLAYTMPQTARAGKRERLMRNAWREAAARFVISDRLGQEYSRRYGAREFIVVTDGLTHLSQPHSSSASNELRIYFMGLFHMAYERNLRALLDAIALLEKRGLSVNVTLRCEHVRPQVLGESKRVQILPFASEEQVQRDMHDADLLYMPMPFGDEHANFARYSLSTKMVTYVGSGVPILYHGPQTSAAFHLLNSARACIPLTTIEPDKIAGTLTGLTPQTRNEVAANALGLAREQFMLSRQTERFWGAFAHCLVAQ